MKWKSKDGNRGIDLDKVILWEYFSKDESNNEKSILCISTDAGDIHLYSEDADEVLQLLSRKTSKKQLLKG